MEYRNAPPDSKNPKGRTDSEYRRIFYGGIVDSNSDGSGVAVKDKAALRKAREKRFARVFLVQCAVCAAIVSAALGLRYARPDTFESVSSVLSGFYSDNITLSDLNELLGERIANNDALATFFNLAPAATAAEDGVTGGEGGDCEEEAAERHDEY